MRFMRLPSEVEGARPFGAPPRPLSAAAACCCCCWWGMRCVSLPTRTMRGCARPPPPPAGMVIGAAPGIGIGGRPAAPPSPMPVPLLAPPNCSCRPPPGIATKPLPSDGAVAAAAAAATAAGGAAMLLPRRLGAEATRAMLPGCPDSMGTAGAEAWPPRPGDADAAAAAATAAAGPRRRRPDRLVPRAVHAGVPPLPSSSLSASLPSLGSSSSSSLLPSAELCGQEETRSRPWPWKLLR